MSFRRENKRMKKKLKYILPISVVLIVAVILVFVFLMKEESYRVIQVSNVDGTAEVEREEIGVLDAYNGMRLQTEDAVLVEAESYLYLKLDEDKYAMLEPGTKIRLKATGNSTNSKTSIYLESGAIVNRLDSKLSEESSYEISTPNSTMAIRGTIFRVEVLPTEDGSGVETLVSVYEGEVASQLIQPDGTIEDAVILVANDKSILIRNTETETTLVNDPENVEYEELKKNVLDFIMKAIEEREDSGISQETEEIIKETLEALEEPTPTPVPTEFTVTFRYQGTVFATQKVLRGECATAPLLVPSMNGGWEFDFSAPITEDVVIDWKE